jgi:hypothetical protein
VRRKDREVIDIGEIETILGRCDTVRVAFVDGDEPYIVAFNFGYVPGNPPRLYFHCANEGRKLRLMEKNPKVCFQSDCGHVLVQGEPSCRWGMKFESVVGFGVLSRVEDENERRSGLEALMRHYGAHGPFRFDPAEIHATTVLRLDVREMTGKRKS